MHDVIEAAITMLKLLDYSVYDYEDGEKVFLTKLENSILRNDLVFIEDFRLKLVVHDRYVKLMAKMFTDVDNIETNGKDYNVIYNGTREQVAKMIIEFDDRFGLLIGKK